MRTRARGIGALALLGASLAVGCGNYSNEDLTYMSVVPERQDLVSNLPEAQSAVQIDAAAELYRTTHNVTQTLNGILDKFIALIETVRSYSPTSRTATSRTWGPYPSPEHPGWKTEMQISRDFLMPADKFDYWFGFVPAAMPHGEAVHVLDGDFQVGKTLREGHGDLNVSTAASRTAGIDLGFGFLDHMEISYDVTGPTISVQMNITNLPNPAKPDDLLTGFYQYASVADGRGAMTFTFQANSVPGPAIETFRLTSRWLGTGEGRGEIEVVSGDAAGAKQTECWGPGFAATYNLKPWAPSENVSDPSSCPDIPTTL